MQTKWMDKIMSKGFLRQFHVKLMLLQLLVVLSILSISMGWVTNHMEASTKQRLFDNLEHDRKVLESTILVELENIEGTMGLLATSKAAKEGDLKELDILANKIVNQNPLIKRIHMMDANGDIFFRNYDPNPSGNRADRAYFKLAMAGKSNYSDVIISIEHQETIVVYATPLKVDGKVIGVVGATVDLAFLGDLVSSERKGHMGKDSFGVIVDSKGIVIGHPDDAYMETMPNISNYTPIAEALKGNSGYGTYLLDGERAIVSYAPIKKTGWGIQIQISEKKGFIEIAMFKQFISGTMLGVAIVTFLAIVWLSRYLKRPLHTLLDLIGRFDESRELPEKLPIFHDEFDSINESFIKMGVTIQNDQIELENRIEERTRDLESAKANLERTLSELNEAQARIIQGKKMASLYHMSNTIAHETNTPLGNALMTTEMLEVRLAELVAEKCPDSEDAQEVQGMIRMIEAQLKRIESLMHIFTRMKGYEQGPGDDNYQKKIPIQSDLNRAIDLMEMDMKLYLEKNGLTLEVVDGLSKPFYYPYADKLAQILWTFVHNSSDHSHATHVRMEFEAVEGRLIVRYFNDGDWIPEDKLDVIFEPFFKGNMGKAGFGVGLTTAYLLVTDFLEGNILCRNVEPKGVEFRLELPYKNE